MRNLLASSAAIVALAATALTAAAPADAQRYGYRHGGGDTAAVVGAGILGLALGAAIASDRPHYGYADYDYAPYGYAPSYYGPGYGYYAPPVVSFSYSSGPRYRGYYDRGHYGRGYGREHVRGHRR